MPLVRVVPQGGIELEGKWLPAAVSNLSIMLHGQANSGIDNCRHQSMGAIQR